MIRSATEKIVSYTMLFIILLSSFASCTEKGSESEQDFFENIIDGGELVYFCEGNSIFGYNKSTGSAIRVYTVSDTAEEQESNMTLLSKEGGRIYFSYCQGDTVHISSYDIATNEITELTNFCGGSDVVFSDGYAYYIKKVFQGNKEESENAIYNMFLYRQKIKDISEEQLLCCNDDEIIVSANGGIVLLQSGSQLTTFDTKTGKIKTVFRLEDRGYTEFLSEMKSIDGKVYFLCGTSKKDVSEYTGKEYILPYLVSLDLTNGRSKKMLTTPVYSFCISENRLYYVPYQLRTLFIPPNYKYDPNSVMETVSDSTLRSIRYNGDDDREEYSNIYIEFSDEYTVINNVMFGKVNEVDDAVHEFVGPVFISVDLISKEIKKSPNLSS